MKKILIFCFAVFCSFQFTNAQLITSADGGSRKAMVSERIGVTDVTISYGRPGVKGREGKIWGTLVPYGFNDLNYGTSKLAPWRAGANENTTIEFSTDVKINNMNLPAGKYGFFIAVGPTESTLIFSKNNWSWGSFFYKSSEDALRVQVKQIPLDKSVEWLKYEFINQTPNSAVIALQWEKLMFAFKAEVDVNKTQLESFRRELQNSKGFDWQPWVQAADWCADNNTNLTEALVWADYAISGSFVGERNFKTLAAKARLLSMGGNSNESALLMKEALLLGSMIQIHGYARQLLTSNRITEAAEVFKYNYKKYPNQFTTNMGMARALSSEGNYKGAIVYATAALPQAPDAANKQFVKDIINKLIAGKDIN